MNVAEQITRRLRSLLRLGVLIKSDSSGPVQTLQVAVGGETLTDVEHLEPYGFTSKARSKVEVLLAALKGNPSHTVAVCVGDRKFRFRNLAGGEVAMYDDLGHLIHFKRDKMVVTAPAKIELIAPNVEVVGDTTFTGTVTANGKRIDETHTHNGVDPGAGNSGDVN